MFQYSLRVFIIFSLSSWLGACGSDSSEPVFNVTYKSDQAEKTLIENVRVFDSINGIFVDNQDVFIDGQTISQVSPHSDNANYQGLRINATGQTLLPGFIDMHGHINADSSPTWERATANPERNLKAYLYAGVTTVFDPADASGDAFSRRQAVKDGSLIGPTIFTTGPLLTHPDGHPISLVREFAPAWLSWLIEGSVATGIADQDDVDNIVNELVANQADMMKVVADRIPLSAPRFSNDMLKQLVDTAAAQQLRTVAHIGTTQDAIDAADAGVAAWVHGVYKEAIPEDKIQQLVAYQIPMVATIEVFNRYGREGELQPTPIEAATVANDVLDSFWPVPDDFELGGLQSWRDQTGQASAARSDNIRRLHAAGMTILVGSDTQAGVFPGAGLHRELHNLHAAGLTVTQVLQAATINAARFLSQDEDPKFGSIQSGKIADLVLIDGDPSVDLKQLYRIKQVLLRGQSLQRSTKNL